MNTVPWKRSRRVMPGFSLSLGITTGWLGLIILLPLSLVVLRSMDDGWEHFLTTLASDRVLAATRLTFGVSLAAALTAVPLGLLVAWTLVRYEFPGRRVVDSLVDLPFALPTAVAGIALTTLYSRNGWIGQFLYAWGIESAFSPLGIGIALLFVAFPFVVRSVQPVLEDWEKEFEEAAATLGASRWTTFRRVIFPALLPASLAGFTMALARAIGEYGSIVFISGNMPGKTEILPLLIVTKLEQYDYAGAAAVGVLMLAISFLLLFGVNLIQRRIAARRSVSA